MKRISEIINLKSAGALLAAAFLFLSPQIGNPVIQSVAYLICIAYIGMYCYNAYKIGSDPITQAEQEKKIKSIENKIKAKLRRKA